MFCLVLLVFVVLILNNMLVLFLLDFISVASSVLFSWLPSSEILPWGIDSVFVTMASYFRGAIETLPYLEVVLSVFIYGVLFEIGLMVVKVFLGHRAPNNLN